MLVFISRCEFLFQRISIPYFFGTGCPKYRKLHKHQLNWSVLRISWDTIFGNHCIRIWVQLLDCIAWIFHVEVSDSLKSIQTNKPLSWLPGLGCGDAILSENCAGREYQYFQRSWVSIFSNCYLASVRNLSVRGGQKLYPNWSQPHHCLVHHTGYVFC